MPIKKIGRTGQEFTPGPAGPKKKAAAAKPKELAHPTSRGRKILGTCHR